MFVPAYQGIFRVMRAQAVRRIIAVSTFSVHDPKDRFNFMRWLLTTMVWAMAHGSWKAIIDVARTFDTEAGDLDWTLVRVGLLTKGPAGRAVDGYVGDGKISMSLRRTDLAEWTLTQAAKSPPEHVREKPGLASAY